MNGTGRSRLPWGYLLVALLCLWLLPAALGQTTLLVSGQEVPGLDQQTVAGVSYAPAQPFARALGAELEIGFSTVELRMGGRLLQLRLTGDPDGAAAADSVAIDGTMAAGHAAVQGVEGVMLPVKTAAEAFGGHVTVLSGNRNAVEVRMPTAAVTALERRGSGASERLVVTVSAPVPVRTYFNERLSTLQLHFSRTRPPSVRDQEGDSFLLAGFLSGTEEPELRVSLAPGSSYSLSSQPAGSGWQLVIAFTAPATASPSHAPAAEAAAAPAALPQVAPTPSYSVLLDPAAQTELVDLALAVAASLRNSGVEVTVSRTSASQQLTTLLGAATADIQLSITAGSSDSLHILGDVTSEAGLTQAAELAGGDMAEVERLRRELLVSRDLDLEAGAATAALLGEQLGFTAPAVSLPLAGLLPAGGRGVRLALAAESLMDPGLAERLAAGLLHALESQ